MLTNLKNCKAYLNIEGNEDDEFIKQLIKYAQATIEGYCCRKFELNEYTEEVHLVRNKLFTNNYPIVEVDRIVMNGRQMDDYMILPYAIFLNDKELTLTGGYNYPETLDKIAVVTYTAGYESYDLPQEIVFACTKLTAFYYKEAREDRLGITSERLDVMSTNFTPDIPVTIINMLKPYRKVKA